MTIEIEGIELDAIGDAIQHWYASGRGTVTVPVNDDD